MRGLAVVVLGFALLGSSMGVAASTDVEKNKALVRDFFKKLDAGEFKEAFKSVSDKVEWWVPNPPAFKGVKNKQVYLALLEQIQKGFPQGLRITIKGITAEEDRVAVEAESQGTHISKKEYNNHYHFLVQLAEEKEGDELVLRILKVREHMDTYHLYELITPTLPGPAARGR